MDNWKLLEYTLCKCKVTEKALKYAKFPFPLLKNRELSGNTTKANNFSRRLHLFMSDFVPFYQCFPLSKIHESK